MNDDDGLTTGRRMSSQLADALDNCLDRREVVAAMRKLAEEGGPQAPLYSAIALELLFVQLREAEALQRMEALLDCVEGDS